MRRAGVAVARIVVGRRSKYVVVLLWLAVVLVAGPLAGKLSAAENNDNSSYLPADAESTKVLDLESTFQSPNLTPAVVVYDRPSGLTAADRAKIESDARRFGSVRFAAGVKLDGAVTPPAFSRDGQAAETVVPVDIGKNGWTRAPGAVDALDAVARGDPGLAVEVTGQLGYSAASSTAFKGIDGTLLYGAALIVVLILLLTYRSPTLWMLPVLSAGVALASAEAVVYELSRLGLVVDSLSVGIVTVLVFGAGTDYALLLVARYREELRRHEDRHQAMFVALRRASPAVVASASTVILGLLCLVFAESHATSGLGPVAAVGVAVALLTMLTLLPALLVVAGRWIFWPVHPRFGSPEPTVRGPWARMGARIARHPRRTWIGTALCLGALGIGITTLHADGLTNAQSYRGRPAAVVGEDVMSAHFPSWEGSPVIVISDRGAVGAVQRAVGATKGIASVTPPLIGHGKAFFQATLSYPPDSQAAYRVVDHVRAAVRTIPDAGALVGGSTAINLDVERAAAHDRNLIIPIVLLVVLGILVVLLRALVAPVMLIATVVLSLFAALGASALVFRYVFHFAGADTALPLYVFVFLVALGIDYNIFLMTRVREESRRQGTRQGALAALAATGGVITSAGCVLAGTFLVLATLPLTTFTEVGFAVALGVLLDTVVVRSVLVTALNLELGEHLWWPGRVRRGPEEGVRAVTGSGYRPEVAPAEVAPTDVAPTDVAPADVAPADVAPADVVSTEVAPADVASADVASAERVRPGQLRKSGTRGATVRSRRHPTQTPAP